jgi:hypothetical protein
MVEKVIKIVADTQEATKEIKELFTTMVEQEKKAQKETEELNKEIKEIGKTSKNAEKGIKAIGGAFKGVGLAIKALGIGLLLEAMAILKDLFMQNQQVADFFSTTFEVLSIAFNDFFSFVIDNSGTVVDFFKAIFENPLKSIKQLGQLIKDNLIERFNSLLEVTGFLGLALKKLFEGDFSGALDAVKEAGKEAVDVLTGVDGTTEKVTKGVNNLVEAGSKYLKQTVEQAKANVNLKNTAQLAAAEQARLVEQYDRQAEKLRQVRDADLNSIADRIKANEELAVVLEKQEKAMLAAADAQIAAAQANLDTNKTIENQVALTDALANKEGVLAQIEGFRSEQLANRNALLREQYDLNLSIAQGEDERRLAQLEWEEGRAETEAERLEKERERLDLENEMLLEDIETKREIYAEGTQARLDSENEYLLRKQEIDNAITDNTDASAQEQERIAKETADTEVTIAKAVGDNKVALAGNTLNLLGTLAKEGSDLAKGVAVAQATIDTYSSAVSSYNSLSGIPIVGPVLGGLAAAAAVAAGLANVKKILSTKPIEKSAPSGGGSVPAAPQAPSFNLVEGTGSNQIAEGIAGQENQPLQAYVVSGEVSTAQSLDRNIVDESGF